MSRRVYLHIGAPKTGTTYLQDRMSLNAETLAEHGVHFPTRNALTRPALSHFRAALDLLGQDWGGPPGHADGAWEALLRRVRRLEGTVVISHEILAPARPEVVARVMHDLRDAEVHVVYSARDWGRQLPAAWQESIKQGRTWTYRRFRRKVVRGVERGRQPWFARAFDLPTVLATWGADLPPERVHVITVPHERGDALWSRWCGLVGIDPAWAPLDSTRANASLGAAETQVLRRLNKRLGRTARRAGHLDPLVLELAERHLVARTSTPLRIPPRLRPWALAQAERWTAWVTEAGVDVVGDLADLVPGPRATDYVDPDRTSKADQLGVALDALATMTLEAASRPDPDASFARRVRRRLRPAPPTP